MCGRFAMDDKVNEQIVEFVRRGGDFRKWTVSDWIDWEPSWNIAPTEDVPILMVGKDDGLRFERAYWSLVPGWSPSLKLKYPTFNARAEGITEKATWKGPIKSHRAIILANGYYEWTGEKGAKTPYFIHHPDADVIGFAGMYSWWADPAKEKDDDTRWTLTATILTSDAVQTLEDIHDRNPVVLPPELWPHWIDPTVVGDQALVDDAVAAGVAEASELTFYQVAPLKDDGPHLVRPLDTP